ncbi:hypothetical protein POM88_016693 [Heracleum sosnowskyi]|uniref:Uncharacterized protein n=1 Tax=Heracleum sosnowskyi TaxID=360622 RepID=A0AAD8MT75_9APIA|nr:hypothetical protein POM88_016693 [Heracleum sosnowskyi]
MSSNSPTQWHHRLQDHTTAVKALAWCPFQKNLLASGGGTSDICIKLWNTNTGESTNSLEVPINGQGCRDNTSMVLYMSQSLDGRVVASAAANSSYVRATRSTIPPSRDGFIPIRPREMDFVFSSKIDNDANPYMLSSSSNSSNEAYRNHLAQALNINTTRIFSFRNNSSIPVSIDHSVPESSRRRYIPHNPERTLDAPGIADYYFFNVLDWGSKNVLVRIYG